MREGVRRSRREPELRPEIREESLLSYYLNDLTFSEAIGFVLTAIVVIFVLTSDWLLFHTLRFIDWSTPVYVINYGFAAVVLLMYSSASKEYKVVPLWVILIICIFWSISSAVITVADAQPIMSDIIDYQIIDAVSLLSTSSQVNTNNITLFGGGVAMRPDRSQVMAVGFDKSTGRQFTLILPLNVANGNYAPGDGTSSTTTTTDDYIFMGDIMQSGTLDATLTPTDRLLLPICLSNSDCIAVGNKLNGNDGPGSVIIACSDETIDLSVSNKQQTQPPSTKPSTKPAPSLIMPVGRYKIVARLFTDELFNMTNYPLDMVCTRNMSTIYVTETSTSQIIGSFPFVKLNVYSRTNNAWVVTRTEKYYNGTELDTAPIALSANELVYAIRGSYPNLVYTRDTISNEIISIFDTQSIGLVPKNLALDYYASTLFVGDYECSSITSDCLVSIRTNDSTVNYLNSPSIPSGFTNQLSFSLSASGNKKPNSGGVVAGIPGVLDSIGALLSWKQLSSMWTPPPTGLLNIFGVDLTDTMRMGATALSHNLISDDELYTIVGAPGNNGGNSSGIVMIIKNAMAFLTPTSAPTVPAVLPPPTATPTESAQISGLIIAIIVASCIAFVLLLVLVSVAITKCLRSMNNVGSSSISAAQIQQQQQQQQSSLLQQTAKRGSSSNGKFDKLWSSSRNVAN